MLVSAPRGDDGEDEDADADGGVDSSALINVVALSPCGCSPGVLPSSTCFAFSAALKRARSSLSRLLASHRETSNGEKKLGSPELERPKPKSHQHLSRRCTIPSIGGDEEGIAGGGMEDVTAEEGGEVREV